MNSSVFNDSYIKYELDTYQYTEIHEIELEIPKYFIRFLFIHPIVRKIGISREVINVYFSLLL
ncbi:hypothetical protein COE91_16935 [Bacillus toyonensis]|nr:hypothetical protein COE91_16935 [Bacillus toyonensis]